MIEAGKSFCPHCVGVHEGAYYSNADLNWGVWLKRAAFGKYKVEATNFKRDTPLPKEVTLVPAANFERSIDVKVKQGEDDEHTESITLYRACPKCAEEKNVYREMLREVGKYPTFVVGMIGEPAAGKSAWLDSIATLKNIAAVNDEEYLNRLSYITITVPKKRPASTPVDSRGQTKLLEIKNRVDNRTVALVYLVDVGGELYKMSRTENDMKNRSHQKTFVRKFLGGNGDYPGADAFIFVAPAVSKNKVSDSVMSALEIYSDLVMDGLVIGKPLAFVMTHADELIEQNIFQEIDAGGHTVRVPVMTKDTFTKPTSYRWSDLRGRVAVEHAIARAYDTPVLDTQNAITKGFLVQSCSLIKEEQETSEGKKNVLMEDFSQNLNVMDPLLWVLNQLKLFPLEGVR